MNKITIQPVTPCGAVGKCMASPSSYASRLSSYRTPSAKQIAQFALQELEKARAADIKTHDENAAAIENNLLVVARVNALMDEIGMPKSWSERDTKSRARYPKTITRDAGWISDLARHCKVNDQFEHATHTYERLLRDYQAYAERAEREDQEAQAKVERERAAEIERRKADMELAALLVRYSLPIESTWDDVLEHLRGKHQRLDLAVAMSQTRGDWSEGPYRVRDALDRFTIASDEDKEIAADVATCLYDFEDGRVFRDTTWSYSALFASIEDQQLVADCSTALARADR